MSIAAALNSLRAPSLPPLHAASEGGDVEAVGRALLDDSQQRAAAVDESLPSCGSTPLILAAMAGHAQVVSFLLDRGAKINYQRKDGT